MDNVLAHNNPSACNTGQVWIVSNYFAENQDINALSIELFQFRDLRKTGFWSADFHSQFVMVKWGCN